MKLDKLSETINQFRIIPRVLIVAYGFMTWSVTEWFMYLPDPSAPQAALVSTVWGAGAIWFNAYTNTGGK